MEKTIIVNDFTEVFSSFITSIEAFKAEDFNKVPFEGSWTAAQVVEHIILSASGFGSVLNGAVKDTDRAMDERIPVLKSIFLNFNTKLNSPDFIKPSVKNYDKEESLAKVVEIKEEITKEIPKLDLSKTCLGIELPSIGLLTRLEAIYFVIYHTQRHNKQLDNILHYLKMS